jgi:hypothetical protein
MTLTDQFWLNWLLNLAIAIGTFGAVFIALFGEYLRSKIFPARLAVSVNNLKGVYTPIDRQIKLSEEQVKKDAGKSRYYHVVVANKKKWPRAGQVQLFLKSVEQPNIDGELEEIWSGDIPICWRNQPFYPALRDIGSHADCDLFSIQRYDSECFLSIHPLFKPYNLNIIHAGSADFVLCLQARSDKGESPLTKIRIKWNGEWNDGELEMSKNVSIKIIS